ALATVTGESIASFNTPPIVYLAKPSTGIFLMLFYGLGALLLREAVRGGQRGWASWLLFGVAFGALNEGVVAATWFQPAKPTVGYLASYGHVAGVNVIWAMLLTIFHIVYSMTIPIVLAEGSFPRVADRPWLGRKARWVCGILFALTCALGLLLPDYRPYRFLALLLAVASVVVGLLLPRTRAIVPTSRKLPRLWWLRGAGFGATVLFFLTLYLLPHLIPGPAALGALIALLFGAAIWRVRAWMWRAGWTREYTIALASGAIFFGILLAFLPPYLFASEPVFAAPYLALLIWLARWPHP
nr:hypothetical protein [Ktedonobacterales bacterium]